MSCCNRQRPVQNFIVNCAPNCPDAQDISISNANIEGQGLFFQKVGNEFQFYGLMNTDGYITVTLDADNKAVSIDIDPELISGSIPDSTKTVKGKTAYASDAEAVAQASQTKALTPSNLAALIASTAATGLVRLATGPETVTGTDTAKATTPAGVKAAVDAAKAIQVVADSPGRTSATPAYVGQLLYQSNNGTWWTGTSLTTGGWEMKTVTNSNVANQMVSGASFSNATGTITFDATNGVSFSGVSNLSSSLQFRIGGVLPSSSDVPASDSGLIAINNSTGAPGFMALSRMLSEFSVESYFVSSNPGIRNFDPTTADLDTTKNVLATLIFDLAANKKPVFA